MFEEESNQKKEFGKTEHFEVGNIFKGKENGKTYFKPKLDQYGINALSIRLNDGRIVKCDNETFFYIKTTKSKNGKSFTKLMLMLKEENKNEKK